MIKFSGGDKFGEWSVVDVNGARHVFSGGVSAIVSLSEGAHDLLVIFRGADGNHSYHLPKKDWRTARRLFRSGQAAIDAEIEACRALCLPLREDK